MGGFRRRAFRYSTGRNGRSERPRRQLARQRSARFGPGAALGNAVPHRNGSGWNISNRRCAGRQLCAADSGSRLLFHPRGLCFNRRGSEGLRRGIDLIDRQTY